MSIFSMSSQVEAELLASSLSASVKMAVAELNFGSLTTEELMELADFYGPMTDVLSQGGVSALRSGDYTRQDVLSVQSNCFRMELERRNPFTPDEWEAELELARQMTGDEIVAGQKGKTDWQPARNAMEMFMNTWFGRDWEDQILRKKPHKSGSVKEYTGETTTKTLKSGKTKEVPVTFTRSVDVGQMSCISRKPIEVGCCGGKDGEPNHLPTIYGRGKVSATCGKSVTDVFAVPMVSWYEVSKTVHGSPMGDVTGGDGKQFQFFITGIVACPVIRQCGAEFPEVLAWRDAAWEEAIKWMFPDIDESTKMLWKQTRYLPMDEIDSEFFGLVMKSMWANNPMAELIMRSSIESRMNPPLAYTDAEGVLRPSKEAVAWSFNAFAGNSAPRTNAGNAKKIWIKAWDAPKSGIWEPVLREFEALDASMNQLMDKIVEVEYDEELTQEETDEMLEVLHKELKELEVARIELFKSCRGKLRAQNVAKYRNEELTRVDVKGRFSTECHGKGRDAKRRTFDKSTRVNGMRTDVLTIPVLKLVIELAFPTDEDEYTLGKKLAVLATAGFKSVNKRNVVRFDGLVDSKEFKSVLSLIGWDWDAYRALVIQRKVFVADEEVRTVSGLNERDDMERCITEFMLRLSKSSTNAGLLRVMCRDRSMYSDAELNSVKELTKLPIIGEYKESIVRLTAESPDKEQLQRMEDAARLLEDLGEEVTAEMLMKAYRNPKRFETRLQTKRGTMEDKFAALEALWTKRA